MEEPGCSWSAEEGEDQRCLLLKHKIFISHSGAQKPFVEQLFVELERVNHSPFFDQDCVSLPKGEKYAHMILQAANQCLVAVVVLSKEYMTSKWPMVELVAFVRAQKEGNPNLKLLPLFYKLLPADLHDTSRWMEEWKKMVELDGRNHIHTELWMEAVRELRSVNGLELERFRKSEVQYRTGVVEAICALLPPPPGFDTSYVQGKERLCKIIASMFENVNFDINNQGAQYLGLYGIGGLGKTTMCKALCKHFQSEFNGRVCHVELGSDKPVALQKIALRKLTRLREEALRNINDPSEGQQQLKDWLGKQPVFLALDNVGPSVSSREEAEAYIKKVRLCSGSKVLITSRSREILEQILGHPKYCEPIPALNKEEASKLFLSQAAPRRVVSSLTREERRLMRRCMKYFNFRKESTGPVSNQESRQYNPLAIRALGFHFSKKDVTSWTARLDNIKLPSEVFDVLGWGYESLCATSQLIFLDVAFSNALSAASYGDTVSWLAMVHGENRLDIEDKLEELRRISFLNEWVFNKNPRITLHDLYTYYARWLVKEDDKTKELLLLKEAKGPEPENFRCSPAGNCWPRLRRVFLHGATFVGSVPKKVQEWRNVVVLELVECKHLRVLGLQGFNCLRSLTLALCEGLESVTCSCNPPADMSLLSQEKSRPVMDSCMPPLQHVVLFSMESLKQIPQCWNLSRVTIVQCPCLENPPNLESCSRLEKLRTPWNARLIEIKQENAVPGETRLNLKFKGA